MVKTLSFALSLFLLPPALAQTRLIQVPADGVRVESTSPSLGTQGENAVRAQMLNGTNIISDRRVRSQLGDISGGASDAPKSGDVEDYVNWAYRALQVQKMEALGRAAMSSPYWKADRSKVTCLETPGAFGFPDNIGDGEVQFNCYAGTSQRTLNHVLDYTATLTVSPSGCANHDRIRAHFQDPTKRNRQEASLYVRSACLMNTPPISLGDANSGPRGFGAARVSRATPITLKLANERLQSDPDLAAYVNSGTKPKVATPSPGFTNPLRKADGSTIGDETDKSSDSAE